MERNEWKYKDIQKPSPNQIGVQTITTETTIQKKKKKKGKTNKINLIITERPSDRHSHGGNKSSRLPHLLTRYLYLSKDYLVPLKPNAPQNDKETQEQHLTLLPKRMIWKHLLHHRSTISIPSSTNIKQSHPRTPEGLSKLIILIFARLMYVI